MSNQKSIIKRILDEEQLIKNAQISPIIPVVNEDDIAKVTEEIFDQVFDQVMSEMGIK